MGRENEEKKLDEEKGLEELKQKEHWTKEDWEAAEKLRNLLTNGIVELAREIPKKIPREEVWKGLFLS